MHILPHPSSRLTVSIVLAIIAVFLGDILTPLGFAEPILYLVPLLLCTFLYRPQLPLHLAGVSTVLAVAGFVLSPSGSPIAYAILNRAMAVIVLWTAAFGLRRLIRDRLTHLQAEQRWQLLARQTNDILWDWDLRTNAHWWSENAAETFGYDPVHEPSIEAWHSRLHPDDRSRVLTAIQSAIDNGRSGWSDEYLFQVRDGSYRTFLDRGTILRNASGTATSMIGVMVDITVRARAEQALRVSERRFIDLVSNLDSVVWEAEAGTLAFTFVSPHAEALLGYPVRQWLEDPAFWPHHIHPDDRDATVQACLDATAKGLAHRAEYRMIAADGRVVWVHDVVTVSCEHGKPKTVQGVLIDITSQKHMQTALRQSEERLALAAQGSTDAWWDGHRLPGHSILAPHTPLWWSSRIREILALDEADPFDTLAHWGHRLHPEDADRVYAALQKHFEHRVPFDEDYRIRTNRGDYRWLRGRGQATWDDHGKPQRMSGSCQDITERKLVDEALRESETRFKEAQRIAGVGSLEWDIATGLNSWSDETYRIFGYAPRSILPCYDLFVDALHPDDRTHVIDAIRATVKEKAPYNLVCRIVRPSGELRHIRCRGEVIRDGADTPVRMTGTVEDVTERTQTEEQLRNAYERLQDMTRHAAKAEENERRRIAREVHDELGQLLTAMRFQLSSLKKDLGPKSSRLDPAGHTARLNDLLELSNTMLSQVRQVSASLRPAMLDDLGLIPAVQAHAQQFEIRTGIACDVVFDPALAERYFDDAASSSVFRIVQELLTNILRHAQAMAVTITCAQDSHTLTVIVQDNGTGIEPQDETRADSFGLRGISERAALLGGTFTIGPDRHEGTIATLRVPLVMLSPTLPPNSPARPHPEDHENSLSR